MIFLQSYVSPCSPPVTRSTCSKSTQTPFVGRDEKRAPLKTPAWEARLELIRKRTQNVTIVDQEKQKSNKFAFGTPRLYRIYYVNIDLRHQYGIKVAESQTFLRAKRPKRRGARWNGWIRRIAGSPLPFHAGVFREARLSSPSTNGVCGEGQWPLTGNIKQKNMSNICRLKNGRGRLRLTNVI